MAIVAVIIGVGFIGRKVFIIVCHCPDRSVDALANRTYNSVIHLAWRKKFFKDGEISSSGRPDDWPGSFAIKQKCFNFFQYHVR